MKLLETLNQPELVIAAGSTLALGVSILKGHVSSSSNNVATLGYYNILAFGVNVISVSIPGRLDDAEQIVMSEEAKKGDVDNSSVDSEEGDTILVVSKRVVESRTRQLINPAGWAFAIWGPIYLGEMAFVSIGQWISPTVQNLLPQITTPFIAANLFQSLWCASFRPKYHRVSQWWQKYVSVAMLSATSYQLSQVHSIVQISSQEGSSSSSLAWFIPLTMHFGWTSVASILNLNGSLSLDCLPSSSDKDNHNKKDKIIIAVGHMSAVVASALGVGITLMTKSPVYGATLAWAFAACADGLKRSMNKEKSAKSLPSDAIIKASLSQRKLCWTGSLICVCTSIYVSWFSKSK